MEEINDFNHIYFVGSNSRKVEAVKGAAHNSGYDDEHGSYIKGKSPNNLTPGFPMRQIGAFLRLRRDCARLRDRRMSLIVSKGRAAVFLSYIAAGKSVKYYVLSQFNKVCAMIFSNFTIFRL